MLTRCCVDCPGGPVSRVWELPTGHDCMITMPVELSELLFTLSQ